MCPPNAARGKYVARNLDPSLRPNSAPLSDLMHAACPRLNIPTNRTVLLLDGIQVIAGADSSFDNAGIDDKSVFTVVADQRVSLKCHRFTFGRYYIQHLKFEIGKRIGESWPTLNDLGVGQY